MQDIFDNFGVYLHVPFCATKCAYCRFYKTSPTAEAFDAYIDGISDELSIHKEQNGGFLPRPQTMFWGGGTPSILSEKNIVRLAETLNCILPSREWTVEIAPPNATASKLKILKEIGVTRISMGVQSFDETTLKTLGRTCSLKSALKAIDTIAEADFPHFSIDLIFGAAGQTQDEWLADIERAAKCPVDHISAYCLEFENGTSYCGGRLSDSDYSESEREGAFLETAMDRLPELGFAQYEISNYAKPDCECLHNLSTWNMAQWLGLGPAAASQWRGFRFRNAPDFDRWRRGASIGKIPREDIVKLDDAELMLSAVIFGLRMSRGVNLKKTAQRFPKANIEKYQKKLEFLKSKDLVEIDGDIVRLSKSGRLVGDAVAVELI